MLPTVAGQKTLNPVSSALKKQNNDEELNDQCIDMGEQSVLSDPVLLETD